MNIQKLVFLSIITFAGAIDGFSQTSYVNIPKVQRTVVKQLYRPTGKYDPVFGYIRKMNHFSLEVTPLTIFATPKHLLSPVLHTIQVAPFLQPIDPEHQLVGFNHADIMSVPEVTEAIYLWRLAHPRQQLNSFPHTRLLLQRADAALNKYRYHSAYSSAELPSLYFLQRLINPEFTPQSYTHLAATLSTYPKHITLTEEGIPVFTPTHELAQTIDVQLMLANPQDLNRLNNNFFLDYKGYTPFILTKEEHQAANQLLALRTQSEQIPANPSARDLIEIAYNRLSSHLVPYTQKISTDMYKAYPGYLNSDLYQAIKNKIGNKYPLTIKESGNMVNYQINKSYPYHLQGQEDMLHLIVLDAVMGGINAITDRQGFYRAMDAFEKFCAQLENTPQNIQHVATLQNNLLEVFSSKIPYADFPWELERESPVTIKAWKLLHEKKPHQLVGHTK